MRPLSIQEVSEGESLGLKATETGEEVILMEPKSEKTYNFDHVFPSETQNQELYNKVGKHIVDAALNGFNGTLMT